MKTPTKKCPRCQSIKSHNEFDLNKGTYNGLCSYCKICRAEIRKKQYRSRIAEKYGITVQEYNRMLIEQGGLCAICKSDNPRGRGSNFHIDHCHKSNKIRALLCANCNTGIGLFFESKENLKNAIEYLSKHEYLKVVQGGM